MCVLPYPFWELVVTGPPESYNVFNSQSTLTFPKARPVTKSSPFLTGHGDEVYSLFIATILTFLYTFSHSIEHVTPHNCFYILLDSKIVSNLLAPKSFLFLAVRTKDRWFFIKYQSVQAERFYFSLVCVHPPKMIPMVSKEMRV